MDSDETSSMKTKKPKILTTNAEKDNVIDKVYYDTAGYGSVQTTWQEARLKDPTITLEYVKGWFSGNVSVKSNLAVRTALSRRTPFTSFKSICSGWWI